MGERRCGYCGKSLVGMKANAKYCSGKCRSGAYVNGERYKNGISDNDEDGKVKVITTPKEDQKKVNTNQPPLKGVIEDKGQKEEQLLKKNPEYITLSNKIENLKKELVDQRRQLQIEKEQFNQTKEGKEVLTGTLMGGATGFLGSIPKKEQSIKNKSKKSNGWLRAGATALGAGIGALFGLAVKNQREADNKYLEETIPKREEVIQKIQNQITSAKLELTKTPEFLEESKKEDITEEETVDIRQNDQSDLSNDSNGIEINSSRIIRSTDMKKMNFRSLDFRDDWRGLLGQPEVTFKMAVYGIAGHGKSTFCVQLAYYLATNFGSVLYISGEEGFSKTLKDKLNRNDAYHRNLLISNCKNAHAIMENVPQNTYHFIFIDSLNNMKIDVHQLTEIENFYKKSAIITISQTTKDGKFRGSQEVLHNADITLKVERGLAECKKNRFAPIGFQFTVIEKFQENR